MFFCQVLNPFSSIRLNHQKSNPMTKKKIIKNVLLLLGFGAIIVGGIGYYMLNMPDRDVQSIKADYELSSSQIVNEYLLDAKSADTKYLDEEGESKVLVISGKVSSITEDFNKQKVILLMSVNDKAGVNCTFTQQVNDNLVDIKVEQNISVKGVIRSGASYDEDLEMHEHVNLEKCALVK